MFWIGFQRLGTFPLSCPAGGLRMQSPGFECYYQGGSISCAEGVRVVDWGSGGSTGFPPGGGGALSQRWSDWAEERSLADFGWFWVMNV